VAKQRGRWDFFFAPGFVAFSTCCKIGPEQQRHLKGAPLQTKRPVPPKTEFAKSVEAGDKILSFGIREPLNPASLFFLFVFPTCRKLSGNISLRPSALNVSSKKTNWARPRWLFPPDRDRDLTNRCWLTIADVGLFEEWSGGDPNYVHEMGSPEFSPYFNSGFRYF